jgi:hypothetical protein
MSNSKKNNSTETISLNKFIFPWLIGLLPLSAFDVIRNEGPADGTKNVPITADFVLRVNSTESLKNAHQNNKVPGPCIGPVQLSRDNFKNCSAIKVFADFGGFRVIRGGGGRVPDRGKLNIQPLDNLEPDTQYALRVTTKLIDEKNQSLSAEFRTHFTTQVIKESFRLGLDGNEIVRDVIQGKNGDFYITGNHHRVDAYPDPKSGLSGILGNDIFVARVKQREFVFFQTMASPNEDSAQSLCLQKTGDVIVVGAWDGLSGHHHPTPFIAKLNGESGEIAWNKKISRKEFGTFNKVNCSRNGDIIVRGTSWNDKLRPYTGFLSSSGEVKRTQGPEHSSQAWLEISAMDTAENIYYTDTYWVPGSVYDKTQRGEHALSFIKTTNIGKPVFAKMFYSFKADESTYGLAKLFPGGLALQGDKIFLATSVFGNFEGFTHSAYALPSEFVEERMCSSWADIAMLTFNTAGKLLKKNYLPRKCMNVLSMMVSKGTIYIIGADRDGDHTQIGFLSLDLNFKIKSEKWLGNNIDNAGILRLFPTEKGVVLVASSRNEMFDTGRRLYQGQFLPKCASCLRSDILFIHLDEHGNIL